MSWVIGALAVVLGAVCAWGVISPRGQWRVLWAWSVSGEAANEPGGAAYGFRRLVFGLGLLSAVTVFIVNVATPLTLETRTARPPSAVVEMWGDPRPTLINRLITTTPAPAGGLVAPQVLGYQSFADDIPDYIATLDDFSLLGNFDAPGYVGILPPVGNAAVDFADLVVHVRGSVLCIPRVVTMIETDETVQIAVYYGAPDTSPAAVDQLAACSDETLTSSVLVPLQLSTALGERTVTTLEGDEIPEIDLIE